MFEFCGICYWSSVAFVGVCAFAITLQWRLLAFSGVLLAFSGVCGICYYTSVAFVGIQWRLLAFVGVCILVRPPRRDQIRKGHYGFR